MNVLVIGAGMYVTGRNQTGNATVLASLCQITKQLHLRKMTVAARNPANESVVLHAVEQINQKIGTDLKVDYETISDDIDAGIETLKSTDHYDCAIVVVPDHLHYPYAKALIEKNIHCLVVKPFTSTLAEALDLVRLQEERHVYGAVEFHKRFDESNLYAKEMLRHGRIGKLLYSTVDYSQRIQIPLSVFREWVNQSNIFQYLAVHYVDLLYFLTGFRPIKAMAVGTEGILKEKGLDTYDSIHATILWEDQASPGNIMVSQFSTNWIDPDCSSALSDQKYKLVGTQGRLELDQKNRGVEMITESGGIQTINPYFSEFLYQENDQCRFDGYGYKSLERFLFDVQSIMNREIEPESLRYSRPSFHEALISTAVNEAVKTSLINGGEWIEIDKTLCIRNIK